MTVVDEGVVEKDETINATFGNDQDYVTLSASDNTFTQHTITNTDTVTVSLTEDGGNLTESDEENGNTNTYTLTWGSDLDKGIAAIEVALPFSGSATVVDDYTLAADDGLVISGDAGSEVFTITKDTDAYLAEGSLSFTVTVVDEGLVEIDETINASLGNDQDYVMLSASDNTFAQHTIKNEADKITVTLYADASTDEGDGGVEGADQPFSYTIDKAIAADVPTIELYMDTTACGSDPICAEYSTEAPLPKPNDFSFDDGVVAQLFVLHEFGTETLANTSDPLSLPITLSKDYEMEPHETIAINFDAEGGTVNAEGKAYIENLIDASAEVSATLVKQKVMSSVIKNDDKLTVSIQRKLADECELNEDGVACGYSINLSAASITVDDSDVGEISLALSQTGTATNVATYVLDGDDQPTSTIQDPQDYALNLSIEGDVGAPVEQINSLILKSDADSTLEMTERLLEVSGLADEFLEPTESVAFTVDEINDHEYIQSFTNIGELGTSTDISDNNPLTVTVTAPTDTAGDEGDKADAVNKVANYSVTISGSIAANYSEITLSAAPADTSVATEGVDFVLPAVLTIHDGTAVTYQSEFNKSVELVIAKEDILEPDELVALDLSLSDTSDSVEDLDGVSLIQYTIENDDVLTVSFTSNASQSADEGESTNYTYSTNKVIAANYPELNISLARDGSSLAAISDYTAAASVQLHSGLNSTNTPKAASATYTVASVHDIVVEKNEALKLNLTSNASPSSDVVFKDSSDADLSALTHTINNNDYINLKFECSGSACDGSLDEVSNKVLTLVVDGNYESQGLSDADLTVTFSLDSATASGTDYALTSSYLLNHEANDDDSVGNVLAIEEDYIIELDETINLTMGYSAFIDSTVVLPNSGSITITNDDHLDVSVDLEQLDNEDFKLNVCNNSGFAIEGGDLTIEANLNALVIDDALSTANIDCDDLSLAVDETCNVATALDTQIYSMESDLAITGIANGDCSDAILLAFSDGATQLREKNEWFSFDVTTSDVRCDGNCIDATDIVVQNDVTLAIQDTNAEGCISDGDLVPSTNNCVIDTSQADTPYQDVDFTGYNTLAYTFISDPDDAVDEFVPSVLTTAPTTLPVCVQDNNTQFIWLRGEFENADDDVLKTYAEAETKIATVNVTETDLCGMDVTGTPNWKIPSVQELMGLVNIDTANIVDASTTFDNARTGTSITGWSSKYWTSDVCDTDAHWAVDLLTAQLSCEDDTSESAHLRPIYY